MKKIKGNKTLKWKMRRTQAVWMFSVKIMMTELKACLF